MNVEYQGGGMEGLALLAIVWGMFVAIFWMVVGWRAMVAHEQLAASVRDLAGRAERPSQPEA